MAVAVADRLRHRTSSGTKLLPPIKVKFQILLPPLFPVLTKQCPPPPSLPDRRLIVWPTFKQIKMLTLIHGIEVHFSVSGKDQREKICVRPHLPPRVRRSVRHVCAPTFPRVRISVRAPIFLQSENICAACVRPHLPPE